MPESKAERDAEAAAEAGAPDPVEQDGGQLEQAERQIAETEAERAK